MADGPGLSSDPVVDQKDRDGTLPAPTNLTDSPDPQVPSKNNDEDTLKGGKLVLFAFFSCLKVSKFTE